MKIGDLVRWVFERLGWIFCEFAFWWFDVLDHPIDDEKWRWWHYLTFFAGSIPMMFGCFFYKIAGEEKDES